MNEARRILGLREMSLQNQYAFGPTTTIPNYDVSSDGQRFVMVKDDSSSGRLNIVLNWLEELKQRVPVK